MVRQSLEKFLESKRNDGSQKRYEENLESFITANYYVAGAIEEYLKDLKQNNKDKYLEIFDTLDYAPKPVIDLKKFDSVYTHIFKRRYKEDEIFSKMPDIARGRIVCRTLNQIKFLKTNLVAGYLLQTKGLEQIRVRDYSKKPTSSGYRAINYELLIPSEILSTKTDVKYELQLMTEMQHNWIELSHILFYKNPNVKKHVFKFSRAQMIRISGIIQSIDEMYKDIHNEVKRKAGTS